MPRTEQGNGYYFTVSDPIGLLETIAGSRASFAEGTRVSYDEMSQLVLPLGIPLHQGIGIYKSVILFNVNSQNPRYSLLSNRQNMFIIDGGGSLRESIEIDRRICELYLNKRIPSLVVASRSLEQSVTNAFTACEKDYGRLLLR